MATHPIGSPRSHSKCSWFIRSHKTANNALLDIEELDQMRHDFEQLAERARNKLRDRSEYKPRRAAG